MHHYALPGWPSPSTSYTLIASEFFLKIYCHCSTGSLSHSLVCPLYNFREKGQKLKQCKQISYPEKHAWVWISCTFWLLHNNWKWMRIFHLSRYALWIHQGICERERSKKVNELSSMKFIIKKNVWSIRSNGMWWKVEHYNPMWAYSKKRELCGVKILIYLWDCVALEKGAQQ